MEYSFENRMFKLKLVNLSYSLVKEKFDVENCFYIIDRFIS